MREMQDRLETTEQRQNTIVGFLARVAQNPTVLQQMVSVAQQAGLQRISSKNGGEHLQLCVHQLQRGLPAASCVTGMQQAAAVLAAYITERFAAASTVWAARTAAVHSCHSEHGEAACACLLLAGRKKRRGVRSGDESDDSGAIPPEENNAQIIQYMPTSNGDFPDSFLRSLTETLPAGDVPADFEAAFHSLQLGQVCLHAQRSALVACSTLPVTQGLATLNVA